jgi:hypothetical protein
MAFELYEDSIPGIRESLPLQWMARFFLLLESPFSPASNKSFNGEDSRI